jgi:8-oxo-dGTP pyrophosphatase MutT (NUDIX family)
MEKKAVGKQTGGFIQQRKGTRPYRVETLLGRGNDKRPSDLVETYEPQQPSPERQFEGSLVGMVSDEFKKHSALEGMVEGPSPVVGAIGDAVARHATQEKVRGRSQSARANRRPEVEPHRPYLPIGKTAEDLYHGSPTNPAVLDPRKEHGDPKVPDAVFASPSRAFALAYAGRKWSDRDFNQSTQVKNGVRRVVMREMRPGAIEDVYQGASGYVHKVPDTSFRKAPRKGATWEQVSVRPVRPISRERIADTKLAIQEDPNIQFERYNPRSTETRSSIVRSVRRAGEMEDGGKGYLKWRLKGAPPEIKRMFQEELQKTGQYRERVEVFGVRDGKVLGGWYPDETFGVYGGGVDPGESAYRAGRREYQEEAGFKLRRMQKAKEPPFASPWSPGEVYTKANLAKVKARQKKFPAGHRTTYYIGRVGRSAPTSDTATHLSDPGFHDLDTVVKKQRKSLKGLSGDDHRRVKSRLQVLEELRDMQKTGARKEFAPGIPAARKIRSIPRVAEKGPNREWTVSLSKHPAARRGDHHDMRLVDPKGRAHSWAFNDLPEPGKGTYAAQQPTHSGKYARRKKPFSIPLGVYGGTRPGAKVEPLFVQPTEVISSSNDRVHFLRHHGQQTDEFVLKRLSKPVTGSTQSPMWALRNTTRNRSTKEGKRLPNHKPRYKDADPDQIDLNDDQQVMTPKIDGAHTLIDFPKRDRMMRVYSYRPTQRKQGLIEHTFKFPGFHKRKVPKGLQGTILRAEAWASDPSGRAVPASEVGGLLNASVPKSRAAQADGGLKMRLTGIDVVRHNGRDYSNKPYAEKLEVIRKVTKMMRGAVEAPTVARTPVQKKKLLAAVKAGKFPETKEGVVVHELNRDAPFQRAKIRPDHDVYVRRIDTKKSSPKGQASGFSYSFEPDGKIMGRVGTGLSRALRHDMAANPEKYVGRVAKVRSAGRHQKRKDPSQGALTGSPAFKEWHIDKTPPELLKEGEFVEALGGQLGGLAEKIDPENLIAGYVGGRGKGLKLLKVKPVEAKVQQLREAYRQAIGKRDKK